MAKRKYFKAIPAAYVILRKDSKILLLRRDNTTYFDGYLSLPAGHVESGESLKSAAIREAKEEVGVIINPKDVELRHVLNRPAIEDNGDTRIDLFYVTEKWAGEVANVEPHKCSELLWVDPHKLPDKVIPEVRQVIEHINNGVFESEFNW